jgi:hypothetical protein
VEDFWIYEFAKVRAFVIVVIKSGAMEKQCANGSALKEI